MIRLKTSNLAAILVCLALSCQLSVRCQSPQQTIFVPGDLEFRLELLSPISTATNQKGDRFTCKVIGPSEFAEGLVGGYIANVKRSGKAKGDSQIDLAFDSITFSDGRSGNFNATIKQVHYVNKTANEGRADNEGTVKAKSTKGRDTAKVVGSTVAGTILGALIGGKQGAVIGGTIGAGVGVSSTLATRGPDLEFKQGTQFTVLTNAARVRERAMRDNRAGTPSSVWRAEYPSSRYQTYDELNLCRLSVPDNWRELRRSNAVWFAPERAYGQVQGQEVFTHGISLGAVGYGTSDLSQATNQFVNALRQNNRNLRPRGGYERSSISGHGALALTLMNINEATGRAETVNIYTTMLRNGNMFYFFCLAPENEYNFYQRTFLYVLGSIQLYD